MAVAGRRVLLVCATRYGSTREMAEAVAGELRGAGCEAEVRDAREAPSAAGFDAVVVGGPMILGWHRDAVKYVRVRRDALCAVPVAYFITAASLTDDGADAIQGVPIVKDTWLAKPPGHAGRLTRRERYALPSHYLGAILKKTAPVCPRQVAFFAGAVDLTKMNLVEKLFVMLVIRATPGDGRHWEAVRGWARGLPALLFGDARA